MKGKSLNFSGSNPKMIIVFVLIVIVIIIIFVIICINLNNKKSSNKESFENKTQSTTYQFKTARAGHGMALGTLLNSNLPKDVSQKQKINDVKCPLKNGVKGFWVCNEIIYPDGRKRTGCGCFYNTKYKDPLNLFYDDKYKDSNDKLE
jgi:hypothetical protein